MSHDAQDVSRRELMRIGATSVAAASIASLPVVADDKAATDKLPKRRYTAALPELEIGVGSWARRTGRRSLFPKR